MRQHARFKALHPECVLLFRMGDFYELFGDDAVTAHKALGLTLTQRQNGIPMAGVPHHALDGYLRRLIEQGFRVAVCDQIQDPREAKGVVDRAVTRVVTPGTLVDEALLDESAPNQIAAVIFTSAGDDSPATVAIAEVSTGSFQIMDLEAGRLVDELARAGVSEVLYVETADGQMPARVDRLAKALGCLMTPRPAWTFRPRESAELLCEHFGVARLDGWGFASEDQAIPAAGALVRYLLETQSGQPQANRGRTLGHLRPPRRVAPDAFLVLDAATLRSLEIERTMRSGGFEGSLAWVFARCRTAMGKRLLRSWLLYPLRDGEAIQARQRMVGALVEDREALERLGDLLEPIHDVARIAGRAALGRATPRDLAALGRSVSRMEGLQTLLSERPAFAWLAEKLAGAGKELAPLAEQIVREVVEQPPAHLREGGVFNDGVDSGLDEARTLKRDGTAWLSSYQATLVETTGIASLKIGYNQVFGYYIEVTHANTTRVPDEFSRKQTLRNAERYTTPELKEFEQKVLSAESRAIEREQHLFDRLLAAVAGSTAALHEFAEVASTLDVLGTFAETAVRRGYVRPEINSEPVLEIRQGRHPVLDRVLAERFVPNDCVLRGGSQDDAGASLALLTGPNMAGKSTYIRQVALIVLLAHTGSFVPAERAVIGLADRIFTRIGAADELHAGQSTFMVEMVETANILHHATERSVVILDEIGRGTSTLDGLSLAWAIAETLASVGCRTLFATHYHELTELADRLTHVGNLHVSVREWNDQVVFLHRILPGRTDRSYGIHVAKLAGLPESTVARAKALLETLAVQTVEAQKVAATPATTGQLSLFTEYLPHPVVDALAQLDLNAMTPLEAFDAVRRLQSSLESSRDK